jgi:hypothetical protein
VHLTNALVFYLKLCFIFYFDCALSLYEQFDTLVAVRSTFLFILATPIFYGVLLAMLCLEDRL